MEQPWFLNCVVEGETAVAPVELLKKLRELERRMGKNRVPLGGRSEAVAGDALDRLSSTGGCHMPGLAEPSASSVDRSRRRRDHWRAGFGNRGQLVDDSGNAPGSYSVGDLPALPGWLVFDDVRGGNRSHVKRPSRTAGVGGPGRVFRLLPRAGRKLSRHQRRSGPSASESFCH